MTAANEELPGWLQVPGEQWGREWRRRRQENIERHRAELGKVSPDPRWVEPKQHPD